MVFWKVEIFRFVTWTPCGAMRVFSMQHFVEREASRCVTNSAERVLMDFYLENS
jgi:hypothetical protein